MKINKLSIIIPVYNEEKTIKIVLESLKKLDLINKIKKEIIVVNDFSKDNTEKIVKDYISENKEDKIIYLCHKKNLGKGAALNTGLKNFTGDIVVFQDADLEYDPNEFNELLIPFIKGQANVVYGSRFKGSKPHRILFFWHTIGNLILTFLSNMFSNLNLSDMETCYKMFAKEIIKEIDIREKRFGIEPEITAKIAKLKNLKLYEVGISYYGRTYEEGKKIGLKDAFRAFYCILRYNLFK